MTPESHQNYLREWCADVLSLFLSLSIFPYNFFLYCYVWQFWIYAAKYPCGHGWVYLQKKKIHWYVSTNSINRLNIVGCTVIAPNYSKSPSHRFPTALEECFDVYLWAVRNVEDSSSPYQHIFLSGDSAGGMFPSLSVFLVWYQDFFYFFFTLLKMNNICMPHMAVF